MAKLKKNVRRKAAAGKANANDLQARAEEISRSVVGTAQQIWSAGVGAFSRAQGEGSKLFEALVKEGMNIEQHTRKLATGRVDAVRDAVENRVGTVRERATDTWDRLEKVFEERVQRALHRLGVPGREELVALTDRVDALTTQLKRGNAAPTVRKLPAKKAAKAPAKTARKPARKALPKAPKPVAPKA